MRILHVISGLDPRSGGPPAALLGLATAQRRLGQNVKVLSDYRNEADLSLVDKLRQADVQVRLIGPSRKPLNWHPSLKRIVSEEAAEADVIHIHALWEEIQHQAALAAQRLNKTYIIRPCGMLDPWSFTHSRLKKNLYMALRLRRNLARAGALHFCTPIEQDLSSRFLSHNWNVKTRSIVEPNGVILDDFRDLPPLGGFRTKYPQLDKRPCVAFMGRLHRGKGLEVLIPAFAQMSDKQSMLIIIGPDSGDMLKTWKSLVGQYGLEDRVIFTGLLMAREKISALADMDIFAFPSAHENFGIAVIEALAAGNPVIISDQVYLHPEIANAEVGNVLALDVTLWAKELDRWINDDSLRAITSARARPFALERYDWMKIAGRWVQHYEALLPFRH